jgi:hypothetical protein
MGGHTWSIPSGNDEAARIRARISDEWLELTKPLAWGKSLSLCPLLAVNQSITGPARVARRPNGLLEIRGEIFVNGHTATLDSPATPIALRVPALLKSLCSAHDACDRLVDGGTASSNEAPGPTALPHAPGDAEALARLCEEAGWPAVARPAGDVDVTIDARGLVLHAHLTRDASDSLGALVPLTTVVGGTSTCSRDALTTLLLTVSSAVRGVKAVACQHAERHLVGLAAACEHDPPAIGRALSALAVASALAAREVQALMHEPIARHYLSLHNRHCLERHETGPGEAAPHTREHVRSGSASLATVLSCPASGRAVALTERT